MSSHHRRPGVLVESLRYTGFAPIATCHWQGLANIIEQCGLADANRKLGLSWGAGWSPRREGILTGGGRWSELLSDLFGIDVLVHCSTDWRATARLEIELCRSGRPFVAEIDAYHVPSPYRHREHVVHTVIVVERDAAGVVLVDPTNNPARAALTSAEFERMRRSECEGRTEPHKLYAPVRGPDRDPGPRAIAAAVRADVAAHSGGDLARMREFLDRYESTGKPVNVCRVAAERHQAALLFDFLAENGVDGCGGVAAELRGLSEQWYLVHMLTTHPHSGRQRVRARISRLLAAAVAAERRLAERLVES